MVMDFGDLSTIVKSQILDRLDHSSLNDLVPNPTCECVLEWIAAVLALELPLLEELVLWETDSCCAVLRLTPSPAAPVESR
jgi:6-pyruvoyltetrahydropterin/6-carboxytetrahydropterin synthase